MLEALSAVAGHILAFHIIRDPRYNGRPSLLLTLDSIDMAEGWVATATRGGTEEGMAMMDGGGGDIFLGGQLIFVSGLVMIEPDGDTILSCLKVRERV